MRDIRAAAGRHDEATRLLDLAREVDPGNAEVQRWRTYAIVGDDQADPGRAVARLEAEHAKDPDDFRVLQELDCVLSIQNKFGRIAISGLITSLGIRTTAPPTSNGPAPITTLVRRPNR